jgi:hypothetical protein
MTSEEEKFVREVLQFFYPDRAVPQMISSDLASLATQMMREALEGSKAMDYVPRPPGSQPGPLWLLSQAIQIFWRTTGKQRIYEIIRKTVALKHRSEYEIALAGV